MKENKNRPIYFISHIPKTAGTTLRHHFGKELGDKFLAITNNTSSDFINVKPYEHEEFLNKIDTTKLDVLMGHEVSPDLITYFPDRPIRLVVTIRDVFDLTVSRYNHRLRDERFDGWKPTRDIKFIKWVKKNTNLITRFTERWNKMLDTALYIRTEFFNDDVNKLCNELGIKMTVTEKYNVLKNDYTPQDEDLVRKAVKKYCAADYVFNSKIYGQEVSKDTDK